MSITLIRLLVTSCIGYLVREVLKYRSLTGPEKLRLFDMINLIELFPDIRNADKIQALWKDFCQSTVFSNRGWYEYW